MQVLESGQHPDFVFSTLDTAGESLVSAKVKK